MTPTDPALRAQIDRIVERWDNGEMDNYDMAAALAAAAEAAPPPEALSVPETLMDADKTTEYIDNVDTAEAAPLDVQRLLDAMTEFYADFDEAGVGRKRSWSPEAVGIAVIYERLTEYAALAATSREDTP